MICRTDEELEELVERARPETENGKVADYIPALGKADKNGLSVAFYTKSDGCYSAGDVQEQFTLQSISKVITLAVALMDRGEEYVFDRVGMEPTGDPFNSIAKLETSVPSKPLNPMINAGALAVTNMIYGNTAGERLGRILQLVHDMTNNTDIYYSEEVARSEFETSFLNRSLSYFMKQHGIIQGNVDDLLDLYTKQCAIEVNCLDLARIGLVFALDGIDPETNRRIMPEHIAKICKTFMVTCGMYNSSGEFAIKVGIPAKSGVSGCIMGSVPGEEAVGIGIYGPALDEKGNSIAGVRLLEMLSNRYRLSMF
ncbi:glutaminase A [Bacillus marinisedimentorum]|uniref:glutaminase A n=1 Tax=Bacillus marinisedimentorum TaxID=1821260 RepID=UPI0007DFD7A7|nr:glutaminase A [Bacillus marinisedimentorum]